MSVDTYILFELAGSTYGVRSSHVQHVDLLEHVTRVPNTAPAVEGVVFARGQVIPALDLRTRFGLPRQEPTAKTRLIFLRVHERVVALIVDAAREFQRIPPDTVRPIQETLVGISGNYVEGVTTIRNRSVLLLNVGAVLTLDETAVPAGAPTSAVS